MLEKYGALTTLIMDIEGGEAEVLETESDVLDCFQKIIIEQHDFIIGPSATDRVRALLKEKGFKLVKQRSYSEVWFGPSLAD